MAIKMRKKYFPKFNTLKSKILLLLIMILLMAIVFMGIHFENIRLKESDKLITKCNKLLDNSSSTGVISKEGYNNLFDELKKSRSSAVLIVYHRKSDLIDTYEHLDEDIRLKFNDNIILQGSGEYLNGYKYILPSLQDALNKKNN